MEGMRAPIVVAMAALGWGCAEERSSTDGSGPSSGSASGQGGEAPDPSANVDGDCMTLAEEQAIGTDDTLADTDGDGFDDCAETACVSDPVDAAEKCYLCGWKHADPGNLVSTGASEGDVIANLDLVDQCKEPLRLWDLAGGYHILFMTASW